MFIPVMKTLNPFQRYGAVSILAIMTAGCTSYAGEGQYRGDRTQYQPTSAYAGAYSDYYADESRAYGAGGGIESARAAHRSHSGYRAEQLDGDCESRVSLQYGETLSDIAEYCDVSIDSIMASNPQVRNSNRVSVGETLFIPGSRANIYAGDHLGNRYNKVSNPDHRMRKDAALRNGGRDYHVVRRGDTLAEIAMRYDVSLSDIARLNPNIQPRRLDVGDTVYLPDYASHASNRDKSGRSAASNSNQSPIISISPARGPRNGEIRLVGDNFRRGEEVFILYGDGRDNLVRIRMIVSDDAGRIDERVNLPGTYGRDIAYFAVQRGNDTYMSQSYAIDSGFTPYGDLSTGALSDIPGSGVQFPEPFSANDPARLIAVDLDVYRGDAVNLVAHSFPPNAPVSIYAGQNRNSLVKVADTRTGPEGVFQTQVVVPESVMGDSVYFVATLENGARTYFTERVQLQGGRGPYDGDNTRNWDRSSSRDAIQPPYRASTQAAATSRTLDRGSNDRGRNGGLAIRVRNSINRGETDVNDGVESAISGVITNEGISCPTLRDDAGRLYTLLGDLQGFDDGDRVLISGSAAADRRICGQSETIQVFSIATAPW